MATSSEPIRREVSPRSISGLPDLIVFYDGDCSFCHGTAGWLLRHDPRETLHFAPLQGDTAERLRFEYGERFPVEIDTVVLYDARSHDPEIRLRSAAIFELLRIIGGPWRALALLRFLPRALTDAGYDVVARFRLRLRREPAACDRLESGQTARLLP